MVSHLGTLISRVRREEELGFGVSKDRLVNLAEYITYYNDWMSTEYAEAVQILADYGLHRLPFDLKRIEEELANPRRRVVKCRRRGRLLWDPESVVNGVGPVCIHKPLEVTTT